MSRKWINSKHGRPGELTNHRFVADTPVTTRKTRRVEFTPVLTKQGVRHCDVCRFDVTHTLLRSDEKSPWNITCNGCKTLFVTYRA